MGVAISLLNEFKIIGLPINLSHVEQELICRVSDKPDFAPWIRETTGPRAKRAA
jgi:hypothetical protein